MSLSQSSRRERTFCTLPDVPPLCQSSLRLRLPVMGLAGFKGFAPCVFVHIGQHEHFAAVAILGDGGQKPLAEVGLKPGVAFQSRAAVRGSGPWGLLCCVGWQGCARLRCADKMRCLIVRFVPRKQLNLPARAAGRKRGVPEAAWSAAKGATCESMPGVACWHVSKTLSYGGCAARENTWPITIPL